MNRFVTPTPIVKMAFDRVFENIIIGWWGRQSLYRAFRKAHQRGQNEAQAIEKVLIDRNWAWTWFNQCLVVFSDTGKWPLVWQDLEIVNPNGWYSISDRTKAELLSATLVATAYNLRETMGLQATVKATGAKLTIKPGNADCPAEAHFVALHRRAIERGNLGRLPPYFPGDTTAIRIHG